MKPYAVYGKKPRASKTSKRDIISGIPVFLHSSVAATSGNIVVYYDKPPYPRILTSAGNTYWECRNKIEEFFSKHSLDIIEKLKNLDKNFGVPIEYMDKITKQNTEYKISDNGKTELCSKLITPYYNEEPLYLWINLLECPTKNVGGRKVPDVDKILEDYLKRKKDVE